MIEDKAQIHEQREKTLEIEHILMNFNFLNTTDDQDTSKTVDLGFEGEQQTKDNQHFKSNIHPRINGVFIEILNRNLLLHVRYISFLFSFPSFFIL